MSSPPPLTRLTVWACDARVLDKAQNATHSKPSTKTKMEYWTIAVASGTSTELSIVTLLERVR